MRQIERKVALENLLEGIEAPIVYSEHLVGDGQKMFEHAAKLNWEGIISKYADAPYRSDRNEAWLKIKTVQNGKFPVIDFVKDPTGVAALYLGKREGNDLVYIGKVGTGWSRTVSSQIRKQLDTVVSPKSKLTKPIKKPKATWVEPSFTAEVEFRDITSEGCSGRVLSRACRKEHAGPDGVCLSMSEPLDIVMDNSVQIAWDYLKRAGEIDDAAMASRFLSDYIEGLILRGERRRLLLSNKAITAYQNFKQERKAA